MINLKAGKLPTDILKKCVLNNIKVKRPEVLVHSDVGEDCSIIDFGKHCCVLSSDPITGADKHMGYLAVHVSCNDIAASGVEPLGILVTILAPEDCSEEDIYNLMSEIGSAASEINVEILGGHTEITSAVRKIVVSTTAVGKGPVKGFITSKGAKPEDYIVVTKYAGLEGTSIIACDHEEYLRSKMEQQTIDKAKQFISMISVVKEGITGGKSGATSMHDATEGGVLGAVWEIAEASGTGFEINKDHIPLKEETAIICKIMGINPFKLISSGMMVITTDNKDVLIRELNAQGINAVCIGKIIKDKGRRVLISEDTEEAVGPPAADELFNIKEI